MAVTIRPLAKADLLNIWIWLAETAGQASAERNHRRLDNRFRALADFPFMGPERPDIAPGVRHLVCRQWLVLYRAEGADVEIVRVVHGNQDLRHILLDPVLPS